MSIPRSFTASSAADLSKRPRIGIEALWRAFSAAMR